jgi:hypothetical protein
MPRWAPLPSSPGTGTRQKNRSCLPPTWTKEELGKRTSIERFCGRVFLFFGLQKLARGLVPLKDGHCFARLVIVVGKVFGVLGTKRVTARVHIEHRLLAHHASLLPSRARH